MLDNSSGRTSSTSWIRSLITLFVIRFCMSFTFNAIRDIRITDYVKDVETERCRFQGGSDGDPYTFQIPIYFVEFFLPALGGIVADKWLGELPLLRLASVILFLSAVYIVAVELAGVICFPYAYLVGLIPICLANGLGVAPMLAAPMKLTHGQLGSPTPGLILYYIGASLGELVGFLPRLARSSMDLTWIFCIPPLVQILASVLLRLDWTSYEHRVRHQLLGGFQLPTKARLLRYFLLLAPLVLLVNVIAIVRGATYCLEINFYLNRTIENSTHYTCTEVFTGYNAGTIITLGLLGVFYACSCLEKDIQISARFFTGTVLFLFCRGAMLSWSVIAGRSGLDFIDPLIVHAVYTAASSLDGVGNALALTVGYELMYRVAPAGHKNLIMGFLFTVWAIGASIAGFTIILLQKIPHEQPILKPIFGEENKLYVIYIVMIIELVLVMLYYGCVSVNIFRRLKQLDDVEWDDSSDGMDDIGENNYNEPNEAFRCGGERFLERPDALIT